MNHVLLLHVGELFMKRARVGLLTARICNILSQHRRAATSVELPNLSLDEEGSTLLHVAHKAFELIAVLGSSSNQATNPPFLNWRVSFFGSVFPLALGAMHI